MTNSVITARELTKVFRLDHEPGRGLKNRFVGLFDKRQGLVREEFCALNNFTLSVERGDSLAVFGNNGAGKSTLLQLIAGTIKPTSGEIIVKGRVAPLIELGVGFQQDLTGEENIYLHASLYGLSNRQTRRLFDRITAFSGLGKFIDVPIKTYSLGMYMRLAFSVAVHMEPDILLADELLAVGDSDFQQKCLARISDMQRDGMTLILVSHSIPQAEAACRRFIVLEKGGIIDQGLFSERNSQQQ